MVTNFPHLHGDKREVADNYFETMRNLKGNDKVVINSLSEIANENKKQYAQVIVEVIEKRFSMVAPEQLLPILYLVDSICKNHGTPFPELFEPNIVKHFIFAFHKNTEKVRSALYKLRHTWTTAPLFLSRLGDLDRKIHTIDPNWPIVPVPAAQSNKAPQAHKILINPAIFPQSGGKGMNDEEEMERMRKELLRKEKELIELKRKELDRQMEDMKLKAEKQRRAEQTNHKQPGSEVLFQPAVKQTDRKVGLEFSPFLARPGETILNKQPVPSKDPMPKWEEEDPEKMRKKLLDSSLHKKQAKLDALTAGLSGALVPSAPEQAKIPSGGPKVTDSSKEIRDPRRRRRQEAVLLATAAAPAAKIEGGKTEGSRSSRSESGKSSSSRSENRHKDKSPSSSKSFKSEKSSGGKSSSSSTGSSCKNGTGGSRSSRDKDKKPSPKKEETDRKEKRSTGSRKKEAGSPQFSRSPSPEGRISPLPPPPAGRIPKVSRAEPESRPTLAEAKENKRPQPPSMQEEAPSQEKRPRLHIELPGLEEDLQGEQHSPVVGWAKHKAVNPDQFRTPVKEMDLFNLDPRDPRRANWNQDVGPGWFPGGPPGARGFRGSRHFRGRGNFRGRWQDSTWSLPNRPSLGLPDMGFFRPPGFNPGGPQLMARNGPNLPPLAGPLPPLPGPDTLKENPELVRKVVVPELMKLGKECLEKATISVEQYNTFVNQVMHLKESSLNREAERRQTQHESHAFRGGRVGGPPPLLGDKPVPLIDIDVPKPPEIGPHKNDLPMANHADLEAIHSDPTRTLKIDNTPRDIRYYGDTATIVLEDNRICELSFKPEPMSRSIHIDDRLEVVCRIGEDRYTEFRIGSRVHGIKIGKPTRELWIDKDYYECYFANKVRVRIDGHYHFVSLPGPLPSVAIGEPRPDLCNGRVYVLVDADVNNKIPLYLDHKPQLLILGSKPHVLRFVEDFKTLTINGHPFRPDFGGFPMVISVGGKKHYVRLTELPEGVVLFDPPPVQKPIRDKSKEMTISPPRFSPPRDDFGLHARDPLNQFMSNISARPSSSRSNNFYNTQEDALSPVPRSLEPLLTSTPTHPKAPTLTVPPPGLPLPSAGSIHSVSAAIPPAAAPPAAISGDINDLWAKLQSAGLLAGSAFSIPGLDPGPSTPMELEEPRGAEHPAPATPTPKHKLRRNSIGIKDVVLKSHDSSLKERQQAIIETLYGPADLQCKSCGHRFSREEMGTYSNHLDRHFRDRRRERDNAWKAQSRRWYYEKSDWIVSEEIDDGDQDMTEEEIILEQSLEVPMVPVRAERKEAEETCPVCLELFNQIFKQGEGDEEGAWFLHNARRDSTGIAYHPECLKDKQAQDQRAAEEVANNTSDISMEVDMEVIEQTEEKAEVKAEPKIEIKAEPSSDLPTAPLQASDDVEMKEATPEEPIAVIKPETAEVEVKTEVEVKNEVEVKMEKAEENGVKEERMEEQEDASANTTLNLEAPENSVPAPVAVPKPKVEIKVSLTTSVGQVERSESVTADVAENSSEFDVEAIIVPAPPQEVRDRLKPMLKGRTLMQIPMSRKDGDMSGLCSIM